MTRQAFNRVLEMNPNSEAKVDALVGLAIIEKNEGRPADVYANRLKQAFMLDRSNSKVLNQLANFYFGKKDMTKAQTAAMSAYQKTVVQKIQAESSYCLGRIDHEAVRTFNLLSFSELCSLNDFVFDLNCLIWWFCIVKEVLFCSLSFSSSSD